MTIKNQRQGFTLIEILIVVAIIAILASVVLVGLGPTQQSGRDARRLSDLHEVQNGLELYYNKCGYYPGTAAAGNTCPAASNAATAGYADMSAALIGSNLDITQVPVDPTNSGTHVYSYFTNGASASEYLLMTVLENGANSVFTSYTAPAIGAYTAPAVIAAGSCNQPAYCITL
jgi:prepilin-type N-terminal cleavage/methylation domain-containing protein